VDVVVDAYTLGLDAVCSKVVMGSASACDADWLAVVICVQGFGPSVRSLEGMDVAAIPSLQEQPVQSAVTLPSSESGTTAVAAGEPLTVKGYAYSGGGRGIIRVDVSIDGGKTWQTADLTEGASVPTAQPVEHRQPIDRAWAWTFWETDFDIPESMVGSKLQIVSKATDASYNVQPDSVQGVWNLRGINNNAWARVEAEVVAAEPDQE
jgi:sulfite oxidase